MKKKAKPRGDSAPDPSGFSRRSFIQTLGLAGVGATVPLIQGCGTSETGPDIPAEGVGPAPVEVALNVNGQDLRVKVEPRVTLLDALRDHLKLGSADPVDLTGSKRVCDRGSCGACTMIVGGRTVYSCTTLAIEAQGKEIRTVEGLARDGKLHPVQEGFWECHGLQCGYCTPGMIMTAAQILERNPDPSEDEIRHGLEGNLCRCTGYQHIVDAVQYAARAMKRGAAAAD